MILVERIANIEELRAEAKLFNRLAPSYFTNTFAWLDAWWSGYGRSAELFVLRMKDDTGRIVGYMPLAITNIYPYGKVLAFTGSGKACSDNLLCYVDDQADVQSCISAAVDFIYNAGTLGQWDYLMLDGIRIEHNSNQRLLQCLRSKLGVMLSERSDANCWAMSVPASWDAYLAACSKRHRAHYRKFRRDYFDSQRCKLLVASDRVQLDQFTTRTLELHDQRWTDKGIVSCIGHENFEPFITSAVHNLFDNSMALVCMLEIDGEQAAGALCAISDDTLSVYLVGMDNSRKSDRPGTLLSLALIQYAIDQKLKYVDLMRGDEPYKAKLGMLPIRQYRWTSPAPRWVPRVRSSAIRAGSLLKHWLRCTQPEESAEQSTSN